MLRVPRSRGALSGVLLVLLGAWGALIPFIGPSFHYAYSPDRTWSYTSGRLWLEILPGVVAILGGLIALVAATRPAALFGAWLAAMSGAWFIIGQTLSTLWTRGGVPAAGYPVGGTVSRAVEQIGFFAGLGAVILFFAALSLGRFTVVGVREATRAAEEAAAAEQAAAEQAAADRAAADRAAADRAAVGRPMADQTMAGRPMADRPMADRPMADRTMADRAVADRAGTEPVAADRAAGQPSAERLAGDPAVTAEEPRRSVPGQHAAP